MDNALIREYKKQIFFSIIDEMQKIYIICALTINKIESGIKIKFNKNDLTYKASIHSDYKIMLKPLDYFVTDIPLALASITNIPVYV